MSVAVKSGATAPICAIDALAAKHNATEVTIFFILSKFYSSDTIITDLSIGAKTITVQFLES